MTIDECVRALAEKMEPWPPEHQLIWSLSKSPKKFWEVNRDTSLWQPVSPLESAECSERLLEAMPYAVLQRTEDGEWHAGALGYGAEDYNAHSVIHPSRRMAIFLAGLKWQGIEEPTI